MTIKKQVDKFLMELDLKDGGISTALWNYGFRERAFMGLLRNHIKEGDVCIDLGANIGYTTLFMLDNSGPSGHVYAIEPDPHNLRLLRSNINLNNFSAHVSIAQCAISDKTGVIDFWIAKQPNLNSVKKTKHSIRKEEVSCFTLEEYLKDKKYPNFIKMDVEGHEVKIFEGALEYFSKNSGRTNFLVEVHPHFYDKGNDFGKILKEYFKIGFKCKYVVATPRPRPLLFIEMGYEPEMIVQTDGFSRGVYRDVRNEDAIKLACRENLEPWDGGYTKKIVRSIMIGRE
jgi:FkbM family methyltransferase